MEEKMKRLLFLMVCLFIAPVFVGLSAQTLLWSWATSAGSNNVDLGNDISCDANNNSYVTGYFGNTAVFGSTTLITTGGFDIYVGKLDPGGNWLWAVKAGGTNSDYGTGIETDSNGNSYVTGYFQGTATFGSTSLISSGGYEIFIAKLDGNGNWLWAQKAGGNQYDAGNGISFDAAGNCYATGYFAGTATFGSTNLVSSGGDDVFVAKLDAEGNWLWAVKGGWSSWETAYKITTDNSGISYISGYFSGVAYFGTNSISAYNGADAYVAKIDSGGTWLWARRVAGGPGTDEGFCVSTDSAGNAYVTGYFGGTAYFGSGTLTSAGITDVFVVKYSSAGIYQWAKQAGGSGSETHGQGIALDGSGNIFITGYFTGTASFGTSSLTSSGNKDIFAAKLDAAGNWVEATKAGANYEDIGYALTTDGGGNILVTGCYTLLANFNTIPLAAPGHGKEIFVARINGAAATPKSPENLTVARVGNDIQISWDAVTQDTNNDTLVPDAYFIYANTGSGAYGDYAFLGQTTGLIYTDSNALLDFPKRFYRVTAVKN